MALTTRLIAEGTIAANASRTVKRKSDGAEFVINSTTVVGPFTLTEVRLPDGVEFPKVGTQVRMVVRVGAFREDEQVEFEAYL